MGNMDLQRNGDAAQQVAPSAEKLITTGITSAANADDRTKKILNENELKTTENPNLETITIQTSTDQYVRQDKPENLLNRNPMKAVFNENYQLDASQAMTVKLQAVPHEFGIKHLEVTINGTAMKNLKL